MVPLELRGGRDNGRGRGAPVNYCVWSRIIWYQKIHLRAFRHFNRISRPWLSACGASSGVIALPEPKHQTSVVQWSPWTPIWWFATQRCVDYRVRTGLDELKSLFGFFLDVQLLFQHFTDCIQHRYIAIETLLNKSYMWPRRLLSTIFIPVLPLSRGQFVIVYMLFPKGKNKLPFPNYLNMFAAPSIKE